MRIWAVGGGKGGTGKSMVCKGLGMRLAERGCNVILIDADYGGPNLHTYCGIRKPTTSLSQFFSQRKPLEEILLTTSTQGLYVIPGNFNVHDTDNLTVTQKQKLFRHIKNLKADHVILDLGAGTQYDVLDTFLLADVKVCVVAPDALSIENFYLFLKNLHYRQLCSVVSLSGLREQAKNVWKNRAEYGIVTSHDLSAHLRTLSDTFSEMLDREYEKLRPQVVLNQVREYRQLEMGQALKSTVNKFFRIAANYAGHIRYDKDLWHQFGQDAPAVTHGASFTLQQDLENVADHILRAESIGEC